MSNIFQFVITLLSNDNQIIRDSVGSLILSIIGSLIPRVPFKPKAVCETITSENYDNFQYQDRSFLTLPKRQAILLSLKDLTNSEISEKFFPY